ncbi:MAG: SusC/RagA family TonB-linked outer membrane protein [Staphylococcus sp.]|nr:SusC/RagA family TonB-linked outer membrane protein [Staphylococcus sp.]
MRKIMLFCAFLLLAVVNASAQNVRVTGQVLSAEDDLPLIGATVRVQGTSIAAATDANGEFTLSGLPAANKHLEISYIGFQTKVVDIQPNLKIYLEPQSEMMDEVMVVAFGKQKRESFTGSASVVSSADIERQQVTNPLEALNGNVTGLQMTETNSFGSDPSITIRGIGSITAGTEPLIVLDGLPYNGYYNDINPADIASMTVLKDAASNALYGARGANGVILITTKNAGRSATKVTFGAKWGANSDGRVKYDAISAPGQYYEAHYAAMRNYYMNSQKQSFNQAHLNANNVLGGDMGLGGLGYMIYTVPEGQTLIGTNGRLNPNAVLGNRVAYDNQIYTLYPDDWTKAGLRDGFRQEYNVNLSGGNEKYSFYGSLGYLKNEGINYGSDLERLTARLKTEYQAYDNLRLGVNAGYTHSVTNVMSGVYNVISEIAPIYPLYVRDGNGNIMHDEHGKVYDYGSGNNAGLYRPYDINGNYIQEDLLEVNKNSSNAFNIQGYVNYDFLKHFRLTVNGSIYVTENRMNYGYNPYYGYNSEESINGVVSVYHYRTTDTNYQQLLSYNNMFGKHTIDILVGHEYSRSTQTELYGSRNNVAMYDQNIELDGAITDGSMGSYVSNYNVEGYFIRGQYDYDNRYFGSFSFRRDGSSNFHPDHRWGNFWSIGGAWIMTKEDWFPKNKTVNMLKLKASYGEQGNDAIGSYRYTDTYTISNSDGKVAYVFYQKGNPDITWETVGSFNAGAEFELFNSRLRGGLEYYIRNTRDMLMWFNAPYSLGYTGYYDNIGDMRNTGLELDIAGDIVATKNFTWTLGMNLSWEKNRVTYLPEENKRAVVDGVTGYSSGSLYYGEGLPVNTWYLKRYAGVNENGEALYWATRTVDGQQEEYTTTDYSAAAYHLCGSALPKLFGGFNTSIKLYGFDINAQFNYSIGGKKYDTVYQSMMTNPSGSLVGQQLHKDVLQAWSPENTASDIPRWQYNDLYSASASDRWLTNASYLSFRNLTVGYTLPQNLVKRIGFSKVRVYGAAENIAYWTKRKGFDPRMLACYGASAGYAYPMRTISGGLSVEF